MHASHGQGKKGIKLKVLAIKQTAKWLLENKSRSDHKGRLYY